jgi:hypothetical protein
MNIQTKAYLVHLLTATGAVLAMLAMLEAVQEDWAMMFFWLVVAFGVDGIDGPLARATNIKVNAPRIDGVLLDLIIDYLTYVFIPAFALFTLEHGGFGVVCRATKLLGKSWDRCTFGSCDVCPSQIRPPGSHRALEDDHLADGAWMDLFRGLGRVGFFPL